MNCNVFTDADDGKEKSVYIFLPTSPPSLSVSISLFGSLDTYFTLDALIQIKSLPCLLEGCNVFLLVSLILCCYCYRRRNFYQHSWFFSYFARLSSVLKESRSLKSIWRDWKWNWDFFATETALSMTWAVNQSLWWYASIVEVKCLIRCHFRSYCKVRKERLVVYSNILDTIPNGFNRIELRHGVDTNFSM